MKYFPFAPGIPWAIENKKYIVPRVNDSNWERVLFKKNFIVICRGHLLEHAFALLFLQKLRSLFPDKKISWIGREEYKKIINFPYCNYNIDETQYTTPLFLDKENNAYFNLQYNYQQKLSWWGQYPIKNKDLLAKQLLDNILKDWNEFFIDVGRVNLNQWQELKIKGKYIVIFRDAIHQSLHTENCLDWNDQQVRELAAIVSQLNIKVVCISKTGYEIYRNASKVIRVDYDEAIVMHIIKNAYMILSRSLDPLFIALIIKENPIIFSRKILKEKSLFENADFLHSQNDIVVKDNFSPMEVFRYCEGKNEF